MINTKRKITVKEKFESTLLQLRSNLKSDSVTNALSTDKDKKLHEKLIDIVDKYYENIDLFDKQKETLQKLLLDNASYLLEKTNSTSFYVYLPNYRNYANFLLDNYYKNENNNIINNKETENLTDKMIKEEIIEIPSLKFENLPEKVLKFSTWKEVHDWAMKEVKEWEHWYHYISDLPNNIISAMNIHRGATVRLWSESQKLINTPSERDFKRFSRMAIKALHEVNESNPIVSYSELGKKMIEAMDNNPEEALKKYQNEFLRLLKDDVKIQNKTVLSNPMTKEIKRINEFPDFESLTDRKSNNNKKTTNYKAQNDAIASFSKSNPHAEDKDSLDIDSDIDSFAKLMAYKKLETPLSIGLFGKWGSGKSFFMNKLEKRINELSETETFCKNVVHVKFNAWHYSDSNLLASLVYNIFDAIDKDINDKKDGNFDPNKQKELLYKELESTAKLLEEKEKKKEELKSFIAIKSTKITKKENEFEEKSNYLNKKDVLDISKVILESSEIKEDIESLKKEFPNEIYTSLNDFKKIYRELNSTLSLIFKATYKLSKFNKKDLFIYFIFIILATIIYYFLNNENYTKYAIDKISTLFVFISPFIYKIKNNFEKIKPLFENVKNIIDKWNNIKEVKLFEHNKEIEEEKSRLNILKNELHELNLTIDKNKEEETILQKEIDNILDGKYFRDFISTKVDSEDYKKHLGLVSIIRNDFTVLEKFLPVLNENKKYKVDRIVLYIDDLDRCSNDLVVNVLEAVHLLLAFNLFVVVVGIDLRWIKGSLEDKHKCLIGEDITSEQYIEKIFQIPFKIKSLDNENKQNLIKHLLEEDIKNNLINKASSNSTNPTNEVGLNPNDEINPTNEISLNPNDKINPTNEVSLNPNDEIIRLTEEEINLIKEIVDSIGDTPRTITRFINVYRIIRSHKYITNIIEDYSDDYKMLIFLLCETFYYKTDREFNEILSIKNKEYYNSFNLDKKKLLQKFISRFSFKIN